MLGYFMNSCSISALPSTAESWSGVHSIEDVSMSKKGVLVGGGVPFSEEDGSMSDKSVPVNEGVLISEGVPTSECMPICEREPSCKKYAFITDECVPVRTEREHHSKSVPVSEEGAAGSEEDLPITEGVHVNDSPHTCGERPTIQVCFNDVDKGQSHSDKNLSEQSAELAVVPEFKPMEEDSQEVCEVKEGPDSDVWPEVLVKAECVGDRKGSEHIQAQAVISESKPQKKQDGCQGHDGDGLYTQRSICFVQSGRVGGMKGEQDMQISSSLCDKDCAVSDGALHMDGCPSALRAHHGMEKSNKGSIIHTARSSDSPNVRQYHENGADEVGGDLTDSCVSQSKFYTEATSSTQNTSNSHGSMENNCQHDAGNKENTPHSSSSDCSAPQQHMDTRDSIHGHQSITTATNHTHSAPHPTTFFLQRGEVRHLNDSKFTTLCVSALQWAVQQTECQRLVHIASRFPLAGLLALKLGCQKADLCYTNGDDKEEMKALASSIAQCSGMVEDGWRWCEGSVEEVVEGYEEGVLLDVVWVEVVEAVGCLRSRLAEELLALR